MSWWYYIIGLDGKKKGPRGGGNGGDIGSKKKNQYRKNKIKHDYRRARKEESKGKKRGRSRKGKKGVKNQQKIHDEHNQTKVGKGGRLARKRKEKRPMIQGKQLASALVQKTKMGSQEVTHKPARGPTPLQGKYGG